MVVGNNQRVESRMVTVGNEQYNCINCIMNEIWDRPKYVMEITLSAFSLIRLTINLSFSRASLLGQVWLCLIVRYFLISIT